MARKKVNPEETLPIEIIFKENIKELRQNDPAKLSQNALAQKLGISGCYYHTLECKKTHINPSLLVLSRLAAYHNIEVSDLFKKATG